MSDPADFSDAELLAQAREWRRKAIRGRKDTRSIARALEVEMPRRIGHPVSSLTLLDTRPLVE